MLGCDLQKYGAGATPTPRSRKVCGERPRTPRRTSVATPRIQLDPAGLREQVVDIVRQLLADLGSPLAFGAIRGEAQLDRDLGLGSLERVELVVRLSAEFGRELPEEVVAEADTVEDLVAAVLRDDARAATELRASPTLWTEPYRRDAGAPKTWPEPEVEAAETLVEVLRYRARAHGQRTHLIFPSDSGETALTFGELYARAGSVARELSRRGISTGHAVAIMLPTSAEFFYTFMGVLRAGGVPVPIYPPFRADRIAEYAARQSAILANAGAKLLVTFRRAESVARLLKPRVGTLAGVIDAGDLCKGAAARSRDSEFVNRNSEKQEWSPVQVRAAHGSDLALLQYTSGSTGDPKGVMLTHANLLANIRAIGEAVQVRADDVGTSWLPLYHDMGLIGAWLLPMYYGLPLVVLSPLDFLTQPVRWLRVVTRYRGSLAAAPNFAYELCVKKVTDEQMKELDLSSWRAALNGAEPVNPETIERFATRFAQCGFRREVMLPVYGLAEASLAVTVPPLGREPRVDRIERDTFERSGRAVPTAESGATTIAFVSVGRALPRHELKIVDGDGQEVGERVEGFLWFRGPSATQGYYRNPEATKQLFPERARGLTEERDSFLVSPDSTDEHAWVDSGDRAYVADGEVYVTGRVKDIIIKAGKNLYPHEVEEIAGRVEGVRKGCVVAFGLRDESSGTERLVVVAEAKAQQPAERTRIAARVNEEMVTALGMPADRVEILPPQVIPKTSSGKLRREETKRLYQSGALGRGIRPVWWQVAQVAAEGAVRSAPRMVRRAGEVAYGVYATIAFALWIVPTWAIVWCTRRQETAAGITSPALRLFFTLVGCRVRVEGREQMEMAGAKVYVSNHQSNFDVLALMGGLGIEYHFVAKVEVLSYPFIGTFMRRLRHFAFERSDAEARLRQSEEIEAALRRGESVFIFPEGTFTSDAGVRAFQLGAFKAAVATGSPILPVTIRGSRDFLRDGTILPRPSSVSIAVQPPLWPRAGATSDWHEMVRLRDETRAAIARACDEPLL